MVIKNVLEYVHKIIMTQKKKKENPPLKIEGQGSWSVEDTFSYDRKFLHSEESILKMPAFMRAPKQDDYWKKSI